MKILKKVLCVVLAITCVLSLNACGKKEKEEEQAKEKKAAYTISEDLTILAEYLKVSNNGFGKSFFAFIKNNSDDTIVDYSIACVGFDINGNVVNISNVIELTDTENTQYYKEETISTANILPNAVYGLSNGPTEGIYIGDEESPVKYVESAVSYIKFKSGKEWNIGDLEAWQEDTIANFSVEEHKNYAQSLKADAEKAMSNPYLTISNVNAKPSENSLIDALDLEVDFTNVGDKAIRSFSLIVLEFEEGNKGVTLPNQSWTWNYQYITNNSYQINTEITLNPQEEFAGVAESSLVSYCQDYLIIVERIEFEDDTVWHNDYALQFMIYNESEKLL